jgi:pyruvate kinase
MNLHPQRTKIVATIGPASNKPEILTQLIEAGMSVARLNFSHGEFLSHRQVIENIRAASKAVGHEVTIMADLPGPKMRIGNLSTDSIQLNRGDVLTLTTDDIVGTKERFSVSFERLPRVVKKGDMLSLNDGYIQLEVTGVSGNDVGCVVKVGGPLRSRKGLNLPGIDLGISAFTDHDRDCLEFALENGVDAVSQSFVESAADVHAVREAAQQFGRDPFVIAKIERDRALEHLDEIIDAADGIMIARGDLGVEVPIERIALIQKDIMRRANQRAKPVITATQMLESMTTYRLPTRAEVTDVSNAILDGTDCVMLSGESAMGAYPVDSVAMLAKIAAAVEPTRRRVPVRDLYAGREVRPQHLIAIGIDSCLEYLQPAAVIVPTVTGATVRRLASMHLPAPLIAVSSSAKVCHDLMFSYGAETLFLQNRPSSWPTFVKEWLRQHGCAGKFAILTERSQVGDHMMEVISL